MRYRKISAERIFDGHRFLEGSAVVIVDELGKIDKILPREDAGDEIEFYSGIISPGFINSHCHLELSHMKGVIPPGTGLVDFLISVVTKRHTEDESFILEKINDAEKEMYENGISGVADISNTIHTLSAKKNSLIRWYNLVEVINFFDKTLADRLSHNDSILQHFRNIPLPGVLTPHAPYTVNQATYDAINVRSKDAVLSIHNQETKAEDELFKKGTGEFLRLYTSVGVNASPFKISGKSSVQTYLSHFTNGQTILLVHNTFTSEEDILFAQRHAQTHGLNIVYCLCPNANLYIENRLPPVELFLKHGCTLVLGTDSYSSNWQLNMAKEIKTLLESFPMIELEKILQWATSNGARIFKWTDLGTIEKGRAPGLVLLETDKQEKITGAARRII